MHLHNTDQTFTILIDEHVVLKCDFRDTDKRAWQAQQKLEKILDNNEKWEVDSDRRDRMMTRLRELKHSLCDQLNERIQLLNHTFNIQTRQSTLYSRQLHAIQKT